MGRKPTGWQRLAAEPQAAIGEWGTPMSEGVRKAVLFTIMAVWVVVVGFYLLGFYLRGGDLPGAQILGIPIAALIALGRRSGRDDGNDDDVAGDEPDDGKSGAS